jgi:hypothetical protein
VFLLHAGLSTCPMKKYVETRPFSSSSTLAPTRTSDISLSSRYLEPESDDSYTSSTTYVRIRSDTELNRSPTFSAVLPSGSFPNTVPRLCARTFRRSGQSRRYHQRARLQLSQQQDRHRQGSLECVNLFAPFESFVARLTCLQLDVQSSSAVASPAHCLRCCCQRCGAATQI